MKDDNNPYRAMLAPPPQRDIEAARSVGQPITVEYSLTGDDYAAWNLHWHQTSGAMRGRWRAFWARLALLTLALMFLVFYLMGNGRGLAPLLAFVVMLLWGSAAVVAMSRRRLLSRSLHGLFRNMTGRAMLGPRTLTIRPDAIEIVGEVFTSTHKWIGIERIVPDAQYVYLYMGSISAIIVPKRAFHGEAEYQAFVETSRQFQRAAVVADGGKPESLTAGR